MSLLTVENLDETLVQIQTRKTQGLVELKMLKIAPVRIQEVLRSYVGLSWLPWDIDRRERLQPFGAYYAILVYVPDIWNNDGPFRNPIAFINEYNSATRLGGIERCDHLGSGSLHDKDAEHLEKYEHDTTFNHGLHT